PGIVGAPLTLLPGNGIGVYLNIEPSGTAKEGAVYVQKPYLIGSDDKIWEGLPNTWAALAGSPACLRAAVDSRNGHVWVVALDSRILSYDPASRTWTEHPGHGKAKDICINAGSVPYVIGSDDRIYKSIGANGWQALPGAGTGKRIAADVVNGMLWV